MTMPRFTLGHSPDPDDAFMFYGIAENKVDLRGYAFEQRLEDIQALNERCVREELDISAISIHAYAYVSHNYALLPCGASMGDGYGPLVIKKRRTVRAGLANAERSEPDWHRTSNSEEERKAELSGKKIAVPGKMTSAFLALQLYLGEFDYVVVPFDRIFEAVRDGEADAGLIIHEGQLTYERAGFEKIVDLGEWWKLKTELPLPLGGNVVRKAIPPPVRSEIAQIMRESIDYGLSHRRAAVDHSMPYARDMEPALADKFIGMYVNDFTRDYGDVGRAAIREFLGQARKGGYIEKDVEPEFVS
jgi:5,8-dihydroxy-2-naphthoate synthase